MSSSDSDSNEETKQPPKDQIKPKSVIIAKTKLSSIHSANSDGSSKEVISHGQNSDNSGLEENESAFIN
jgi:hypothetical protein